MEANNLEICPDCSKTLPIKGFFCGGCLSQFKCKSCDAVLEKDSIGCVICGTPKEIRANSINNNVVGGSNSFRLHETLTERTIEATFSDAVGKDLAGVLKDTYSMKIGNAATNYKQIVDVNSKNINASEEILEENIFEGESNEKTSQTNFIPKPSDYPALIAIAMKNLPGSESEWIVVYSFYASKFNQENLFTRQNIIEKYEESKRKNSDRMRDLSTYIKRVVQAGYINPLEEGFSILDKGIEKAKEIISRTSSSSTKTSKSNISKANKEGGEKESKSNKSTSGSKSLKRLSNIDFAPQGKESLSSFFKNHVAKSDSERNLLFVYYMQEILKISGISFDHIYTCYDTLNLRISENLVQTIRNTKSKTGWIETEDSKNIVITVKGRNKIKFWDKKD